MELGWGNRRPGAPHSQTEKAEVNVFLGLLLILSHPLAVSSSYGTGGKWELGFSNYNLLRPF